MLYHRLFFALMFMGPAAAGGLESEQIAIIVNASHPDSMAIAEYYCRQRQVPASHIIALTMPTQERISRAHYDDVIAPAIRRRLLEADLRDKIICLITVRGVPLRINALRLGPPSAKLRDLITAAMDEQFGLVRQLARDLNALAQPSAPDEPLRLPRSRLQRRIAAADIMRQAEAALQNAQNALSPARPNDPAYQNQVSTFNRSLQKWGGLQLALGFLQQQLTGASDPASRQLLQRQLDQTNANVRALRQSISQIEPALGDLDAQKQRYRMIYKVGGLGELCALLLDDRRRLGDEESQSAFDSELSLILSDPFNLSAWQVNTLHMLHKPGDNPGRPPLMVARLDGPSRLIAIGLIDKALAAEQASLQGTAYLDARGIYSNIATPGAEGNYDQALRDAKDLLQSKTALPVVLDDAPALFAEGACPDTLLYCGWYSLRNYINAFQFKTGAIGYHVASFEAESLRSGEPDADLWCKRLLEQGITATFGAVAEPYLSSFPRPDHFFAQLISGDYCLVECYYRTKPYNSWMLTLIGDPLYRPQYPLAVKGTPVP